MVCHGDVPDRAILDEGTNFVCASDEDGLSEACHVYL